MDINPKMSIAKVSMFTNIEYFRAVFATDIIVMP